MLPFLHAVVDEDGDVLSTHSLFVDASVAASASQAGCDQVVPLYEISCFDLLSTCMWNDHKELWEVRARGSNTYHKARLLREAVGLAVAEVARGLSGEVALLDTKVPVAAVPTIEEDVLW